VLGLELLVVCEEVDLMRLVVTSVAGPNRAFAEGVRDDSPLQGMQVIAAPSTRRT
jgi:hypothetical protein